jgi:hypothetical protein
VVCVKTKQAILIGVYDQSTQPGEATKVVEALADYLISVAYVRIVSVYHYSISMMVLTSRTSNFLKTLIVLSNQL